MSPFLVVFLVYGTLHHINALYHAYVAANGDDNDVCSFEYPCATFQIVLRNIKNGFIADDDIIIFISGVYQMTPFKRYQTDDDCVSVLSGNITFIFDESITKTDDWFSYLDRCTAPCMMLSDGRRPICAYPFQITENAVVKFYNFIWDRPKTAIATDPNSHFVCDKCTFINAELVLISAQATFINTIFDGATLGWIGGDEEAPTDGDFKTNIHIILSYCTIMNVQSENFMKIYSYPEYYRSVYVEHTKFESNTTFIYVYNHFSYSIITSEISIYNSTFLSNTNDGDDGMIVLHVEEAARYDIRMDDVHIKYSQYIEQVFRPTTDYSNAIPIHIACSDSSSSFSNLTVETQIHCSVKSVQWTTNGRRRRNLLAIGKSPQLFPWCNSPTPFLLNNGIATLSNIYLTGAVDSFYSDSSSVIYFFPSEMYDYNYDNQEVDNKGYFAAILNDYDGQMNIDGFYIGKNSHFGILHNRGTAVVNNLYTGYNESSQNLALGSGLTNYFGTLTVNNSVIRGCDNSLINIYGGHLTVLNTFLSQSLYAMITYYTALGIHINNVKVEKVGRFYTPLVVIQYKHYNYGIFYSTDYIPSVPAIYLSSCHTINISNSHFGYIGPLGIMDINEAGISWQSNKYFPDQRVIMDNNTFDIDDGRHSFDDLWMFINDTFTGEQYELFHDSLILFVSRTETTADRMDGVISINGNFAVELGHNTFYSANKTSNRVKFFVDTRSGTNCMAQNTFSNFDLYIFSGNFSSCKHRRIGMLNHYKCIRHFGPLNSSFHTSHFVKSSIIVGDSGALIIDDAVFDNNNQDMIQFEGDGSLRLIDTVFAKAKVSFPNCCRFDCHQIINNDTAKIRQLNVRCIQNQNQSMHSVIPKSFTFWTPYFLKLNNENNALLYPGEPLQIEYAMTDIYGNNISEYDFNRNVTINVACDHFLLDSHLVINKYGCTSCASGIDMSLTADDVGKKYDLSVSIVDNILMTHPIHIAITECPFGYGLDRNSMKCKICLKGKYSITKGLNACNICDGDVDHITCPGHSQIIVDYNYWLKVGSYKLISSECPNNYCCQNLDGCDYLADFHQLCAANRDPFTPLCGKCKDGYSELIGSVNCGQCDRTHYEYFLIPLAIALIFSLYLLYFDRPQKEERVASNKPAAFKKKNVLMDDWRALSTMLFKVLLYFAQGLTFVLSTSSNINNGLTFYLLPLLQIFNLSIEYGTNSNESTFGYCLIDGLTASAEILLGLITPIMILMILTMTMIFGKCCGIRLQCLCFKDREISYTSAYLRGLLVVIGSVLAVIFKLMRCINVNGTDVHFYYGSDECYDTLWFLSLASLIIIFIIWSIFDVILCRMDAEKRGNRMKNNLSTLVKAYKPECWYWETVLLCRRTVLALFTIINDQDDLLNDTLAILLCIFAMLQIYKQPFLYNRVNRLETFCVFILTIVVIYINNASFRELDDNKSYILGIFLLICIAIPMLLVLYEFFRVCRHAKKSSSAYSARHINRIGDRRPQIHLSDDYIVENEQNCDDDDDDDDEDEDENNQGSSMPFLDL